MVAAIVYSGVMSFVLLKVIGLVVPLRADADLRASGSMSREHGEEAYVPTVRRRQWSDACAAAALAKSGGT